MVKVLHTSSHVLLASLLCLSSAAPLDIGEWTSGGWYVQNDGVMGGRSSGNLQLSDSGARFEGSINLNGGGFASFRRSFGARNLNSYAGLWVEVDTSPLGSLSPIALHIALNDASRWNDFGAAMAVPPGPTGSTFSAFLPFTWFTKQTRWSCGTCSLDVSRVTGLRIMVLYQEGQFNFHVRKVHAVQAGDVPTSAGVVPAVALSDEMSWKMIQAAIQRGSFVWNQGYQALCGAIYNSTALTISSASGVSERVQSVARAALAQSEPHSVNLGTDAAWIFRRGFDHILAAYDGSTPPPESGYPQAAHGDWLASALTSGSEVELLPVSQLENELQEQMPSAAGMNSIQAVAILLIARLVHNFFG